MKINYKQHLIAAVFLAVTCTSTLAQTTDALASWNDGKTKQSIKEFVRERTVQVCSRG